MLRHHGKCIRSEYSMLSRKELLAKIEVVVTMLSSTSTVKGEKNWKLAKNETFTSHSTRWRSVSVAIFQNGVSTQILRSLLSLLALRTGVPSKSAGEFSLQDGVHTSNQQRQWVWWCWWRRCMLQSNCFRVVQKLELSGELSSPETDRLLGKEIKRKWQFQVCGVMAGRYRV